MPMSRLKKTNIRVWRVRFLWAGRSTNAKTQRFSQFFVGGPIAGAPACHQARGWSSRKPDFYMHEFANHELEKNRKKLRTIFGHVLQFLPKIGLVLLAGQRTAIGINIPDRST
jgi:hypothetical protein